MPNTIPADGGAMPATIAEMYAEWLSIKDKPATATADNGSDTQRTRYQVLQKLILQAEPRSPQDVAMMFLVDTDDGQSFRSEALDKKIRELATRAPAPSLLDALIANHNEAIKHDCVTWTIVGDLTEALDESPDGHQPPKVQTSVLYCGKDDDGKDIRKPQFSYSEEDIREVFTRHKHSQLALYPGPGVNVSRDKVAARYDADMEAKISEFRELVAAYEKREADIGLTAALKAAKATSAEVRLIEAMIVDFVPATLAEASRKSAWCAWAYEDDYAYLGDHDQAHNPLVSALSAIGRAA